MKLSLNWIKEFVSIPKNISVSRLAELLTLRTCEVEGYDEQGRGLEGVLVGQMLEFKKHPNADKLNVAKIDIGRKEPLNLIFGQMVKMNVGDRIPVAVAPTVLPTGTEILAKEMRGVKSEGMLCLEQELGMKEEGVSILYFPTTKPGTPLTTALGLDDTIFEVDNKSLTHRPDLWGHYGMAREFAAFLGEKLKPLTFAGVTFPKSGARVGVKIEGETIAARFLAVIMTGIKIAESPQWIKNRLTAVGMRPVNTIVDVTNYVMCELGYPMHAFDRRTVANDNFVIRHAHANEKVETLDHKKRLLSNEDAVVTNGEKNLGIAGVMGGLDSEIKPSTTEIILEVGNWNPVMIRKTAQRHGLRTDAAQRFEKSLDPELALLTMKRAIELILKICPGAKIAGPLADAYPQKPKPISVLVEIAKVVKKIGAPVSEKEMIEHLKGLEFGVSKATASAGSRSGGTKKGWLKVTVPSFRATKDVSMEDDLVEEIARMYGYEKIAPTLPELPIKLPHENRQRKLQHHVREILSLGLGFDETLLYSFYGKNDMTKAMLPETLHVMLENPLTEDQTHMRISLLPNLLKSAASNLKYFKKFKLYEIGRTYIKRNEYFPLEEEFVAGVVARPQDKKEVFYDALGAVQELLKRLGVEKMRILEGEKAPPYAHPSKCASIMVAGQIVATAYELHPKVLANFGIELSQKIAVGAFELNFTKISVLKIEPPAYTPLPRFPSIEIDISVLVGKKTSVREVSDLMKTAGGQLVTNIKVIDIFEDKNLGDDKKSFTFRLTLQSPDRTLTDDEMKEVQELVVRNLTSKGFSIR